MSERLDRVELILERLAERQDRTQQLDQFRGEVRASTRNILRELADMRRQQGNGNQA